ncbi:hypothetical protein HRI_003408200 [Hibiscus trionum]|uniref:CCHC-type domain-containing protein n=1 Tax=Hibiscus trionum TaxID=183268 RepID=A0A9W7IJR4_HIBTR|nr:hypothetical protein HRI_003408200 [Hibiscus trionum]
MDFKGKNKEEERDQIICYECKKPGHIRSECPQLKMKGFEKKKKLKAKLATWSDEESSEDDEHEVANLCLMALDEDSSMVISNSSSFDFTFDKLHDAYDELQEVYDELVEKYKESVIKNKKNISELNDKNDSLSQANLKFEKKILGLKDELKFFQDENVDLNNLLSQCNNEHQKMLDELNKLKESFKNVGNVKHEKGESSKTNQSRRKTYNYKQSGFPRHNRTKKIRSVWVPKELVKSNNVIAMSHWIPKGTKLLGANTRGPKMIWVPKTKV